MRRVRGHLSSFGFIAAVCATFGSHVFAAGPSFDCSLIRAPDEETICSSEELSALDLQAARKFEALVAKGNAAARVQARQFLKKRRACVADAACIASVIASEIKAFDELGVPAQATNDTGNTNPAVPINPTSRDPACVAGKPAQGSVCAAVQSGPAKDRTALRIVAQRGDSEAGSPILSDNGQLVATSGMNGVKIWDVPHWPADQVYFCIAGGRPQQFRRYRFLV